MALADDVLQPFDFVRNELDHFPAVNAFHVFVMFAAMSVLVTSLALSEIVFANQSAFQQQIQGPVDCRAGHAVSTPHSKKNVLRFEVIVKRIDFVQNGETFAGLFQVVGLKEPGKNIAYFLSGGHDGPG